MRRKTKRHPSVIPGFGLTLGLTLTYLGADRADPARRRCSSRPRTLSFGAVLGDRHQPPRACMRCELSFGALARRGRDQRRLRPARRLGAGALRVSRQAPARRDRRPAVRAADRRRRHRADHLYSPRTAGSAACSSRSGSRSPSRRSASSWRSSSSACRSWCAPCSRCCSDLDAELEEAAATLGATRWQTFAASSCRSSVRPCSPASRSPSPARSANTARSSSSPATCRTSPRSRRC